MCRIAGIVSRKYNEVELRQKAAQMCYALAHGGPDDEGIYYDATCSLILCHRRLSIIELNASGHQPMADPDEQLWISFNGEIYNYIELREELISKGASFQTATDTEVILQAYKFWGEAAFGKLRGMFAFALFDKTESTTLLVRDSSGIKPIYYYANGPELYFASEVKAFKAAQLVTKPDNDWRIRFLAFGHVPEPYTTLQDVYSLPKASYLKWQHQTATFSITSYQQPSALTDLTVTAARSGLRNILDNAIEKQLIADAPIGVFLSGGTDSSLLTLRAAAYTKSRPLKTISIFFNEDEYTERRYQETILKQTETAHFQHLVTRQHFEETLPTILADMDLPTTDGVNSWFISKYASQSGLKAVLSGLGADELFGGYPSFKRIKYLKYLKLLPGWLLRAISNMIPVGPLRRLEFLAHKHPVAEYLFLRGLFAPSEIARLLHLDKKKVIDTLFAGQTGPDSSDDDELKAAWYETNMYMQNQLLRDTDVMSMAHGLEVRVPFLDEKVMQFANTLPPRVRFDKQKQKGLLIDAYADILPETIWNRPKMGFSFPLQQWMRDHAGITDVSFYKNKTAQKIIADFAAGGEHWSRAFTIYQLQNQRALEPARKKILLLTLIAFGNTGGIQKMCRTMAYATQKVSDRNNWNYKFWSGYDSAEQLSEGYTSPQNYRGFKKRRHVFVWHSVKKGIKSDVVILTHINMALIGWLIKKRNPNTKVWLVCHGIEVWRPLKSFKKKFLSVCDKVICVSQFTKQKMEELHGVKPKQLAVLNNAIDPFFTPPATFTKPAYLLQRYGLSENCKIIFSLTRLASTEQYKGYEQVIKCVSRLKAEFPDIRYVISGKYDSAEEERLRKLIATEDVAEQIIITGFVSEQELEDHFLMADVFVLPSKKEGFGIVFIEAMACGLPVICGNADGSVDAIRNGELGTAVDTDDIDELTAAISKYFKKPLTGRERYDLQTKCLTYFNADSYADKLEDMLLDTVENE